MQIMAPSIAPWSSCDGLPVKCSFDVADSREFGNLSQDMTLGIFFNQTSGWTLSIAVLPAGLLVKTSWITAIIYDYYGLLYISMDYYHPSRIIAAPASSDAQVRMKMKSMTPV